MLTMPGAAPRTPSHQTAAILGNVSDLSAGSAIMQRHGSYTDVIDRTYVVHIDNVFGPAIHQGTFRWSDTGGASWNADLIPIVANVPFNLSHGVGINWVIGPSEPQHVLGDDRRWTVRRPHGMTSLIDLNRDYEYRSSTIADGTVVTIPWDLGSQKTPVVLILGDHNLRSGTTIRLQSSEASNFAPLEYNQIVPWAESKLIYDLITPASARYWRLHLTAATGQGDIRIGEWYLGDVLKMNTSFAIGFSRRRVHLDGTNTGHLIRGPSPLGLMAVRYELTFNHRRLGGGDDLDKLRLLDVFVNDGLTRERRPFWVHQDEAQVFLELVQWESDPDEQHVFVDRSDATMTLLQIVRTAA
jgi:hypothetical protein